VGADLVHPVPHPHHRAPRQAGPTVNFNGYRLEPDTWPWVRPGHAAPWSDPTGADVTLIIFEQDFLDPATRGHLNDLHGAVLRVPPKRTGWPRDRR
jgi:hypothetical protein